MLRLNLHLILLFLPANCNLQLPAHLNNFMELQYNLNNNSRDFVWVGFVMKVQGISMIIELTLLGSYAR